MAFNFNWSDFDEQFYDEAKKMLSHALNKGTLPAKITDRIEVTELHMGTMPPELEILEIGELGLDKFRGIFKLTYSGDAYIVLQTKIQANPVATRRPELSIHTQSSIVAADAPLILPMQLRISNLRLRGIVVLVVSKQKGVTLVFKNDPLERVDVSSTFDGLLSVQRFLQAEIEKQLRTVFQEDLPALVHSTSVRHLNASKSVPPAPSPRRVTSPDSFHHPPPASWGKARGRDRARERVGRSLGSASASGSGSGTGSLSEPHTQSGPPLTASISAIHGRPPVDVAGWGGSQADSVSEGRSNRPNLGPRRLLSQVYREEGLKRLFGPPSDTSTPGSPRSTSSYHGLGIFARGSPSLATDPSGSSPTHPTTPSAVPEDASSPLSSSPPPPQPTTSSFSTPMQTPHYAKFRGGFATPSVMSPTTLPEEEPYRQGGGGRPPPRSAARPMNRRALSLDRPPHSPSSHSMPPTFNSGSGARGRASGRRSGFVSPTHGASHDHHPLDLDPYFTLHPPPNPHGHGQPNHPLSPSPPSSVASFSLQQDPASPSSILAPPTAALSLATLAHSHATISPYTREVSHFTTRTHPHQPKPRIHLAPKRKVIGSFTLPGSVG